jgi:hypothetical protein
MPDPALCTEALNENYSVNTFDLYLTPPGEAEFLVGNISTGDFTFTPAILEHRLGKTGSLDAIIATSKDYTINFTGDELTSRNYAVLLNEDQVSVEGGCEIPFTGERCVRFYGVRLVHEFPCATKYMEITFWRAAILNEFTTTFGAEWLTFNGSARALSCESAHPTQPYGKWFFQQVCPTS